EGDAAVALVDARLLIVAQRRGVGGDRLASAVHNVAADVGRLIERRPRLEIDAVRHASDQLASLGVEVDEQLLERDRDRLRQRFDVAAVAEADGQAPQAAFDFLRQREADGDGAAGVGRAARRRGNFSAVDVRLRGDRLAGYRTAGVLDLTVRDHG